MAAAEVLKMPKVTLYVKDADAPIWERARQLAGDSLSSIVSRALSAYVDEQETKARAKSELEQAAEMIVLDVEPDEGPSRKVRFTGVLAHDGNPEAYVTTSGKVIVARCDRMNSARTTEVAVFDTYREFLSSDPSDDIGAAVAETVGEEWIEDIR